MLSNSASTRGPSDRILDASRYIEGVSPLPMIIAHALQLSKDDDTSVISLAHALEADPALTAKLLRAANSAYYGMTQRVYTVRDAIQVIGFEAVRSLAITTTVVEGFWVDDELFDRQSFWKHSLRCGMFARSLALCLKETDPDTLFTLGVLHDIGRASIIRVEPDLFCEAIELMGRTGVPLWRAEQEILGIDHAAVGGELTRRWQLPEEYTNAIKGHHESQKAESELLSARVLCLADSLAHAAAPSRKKGFVAPPLIHDLWTPLGMNEQSVKEVFDERDYIEHHTTSLYETAVI